MTVDFSRCSLDLQTLQDAYGASALEPEQLIEALYQRMERDALPGVWISRLSKDDAVLAARQLSARPDARKLPLFGIPFAVKDNIDVAGMTTTAACPAFGYQPARSAPAVQALLDAGALCLGKVNLDQFATGLVGARSPYGACQNVFDAEVLSGGSSSGSAVAVAAHHVSFALGTDTAGSGRVPAALNNIVGLKPSVGLISTEGVVPACASLDCISVFALCVADGVRVRALILGEQDAAAPSAHADGFRFGVPEPLHDFCDSDTERAFASAVQQLRALGGSPVAVDFSPFLELGQQLYGPSVGERYLAVGKFIETHPDAVLPVTRDIILAGKQIGPADAIAGMKRIAGLRLRCQTALAELDLLVTPTIPRPFRLQEDRAEPRAVNDKLGIYTRFANYVGCPVLSVPAGFRTDGLPFGVSLVGKPGEDAKLDELGARLHAASGAGMGKRRDPAPAYTSQAAASLRSRAEPRASTLRSRAEPHASSAQATPARVAVVGAHMRGLALNAQLTELGASFLRVAQTAAAYRLYVLPGTTPQRPGLVRVREGGHAIELEVWELSWQALGALMARVPAPLGIGALELAGGEVVKGFLCEAYAVAGATDISGFGGYRYYLDDQQKDA